MKRAFTVYYDDESGEMADLRWSEAFSAEHSLMQADVLKDAVAFLEHCYTDAVDEWMAELPEASCKPN